MGEQKAVVVVDTVVITVVDEVDSEKVEVVAEEATTDTLDDLSSSMSTP
jgi:hypothetical protein